MKLIKIQQKVYGSFDMFYIGVVDNADYELITKAINENHIIRFYSFGIAICLWLGDNAELEILSEDIAIIENFVNLFPTRSVYNVDMLSFIKDYFKNETY